jgi:PAS domain S-box-containing protein
MDAAGGALMDIDPTPQQDAAMDSRPMDSRPMDSRPMDSRLEAMLSIASRMNGFLYRCQNDPTYTMLYMSEGVSTILGYPASDFIGNKVRAFSSISHPDDLAGIDAAVGKALETRGNWHIDYRLMHHNGQPVWIHEIGGGVFDAAGQLLFLEGFIVSIDDRKLIEEQNAKLIGSVATMSDQIVKDTSTILDVLRALKMLALNARIEAARAGEQGLGFAVVAQEIKSLATKTGESAERITKLMNELQKTLNMGKR